MSVKKNFSNQLTRQISENLVVAELGRREIVAITFSGNVPDIDILAYKNRTSIPLQVKAVKKGNLSANAKDYLDIEFDGDKQKVKGKSGDVDRSLIFVIVYIGEQLEDEKFYICTKGDIQDIILEAHTKFLQKHKGVRPRQLQSTHCAYNEKYLIAYKDNRQLILDSF